MSVKTNTRRQQAPCVHHWLCDPADSLTSKAVCRRCGAKGEFQNHMSTDRWTGGFRSKKLGPLSDRTLIEDCMQPATSEMA